MVNEELYIDFKIADIGTSFGVRINRILLKPSELSIKDAQYSYSVTLPPTSVNHALFNHANIEETRDKFNRVYRASYIANGVKVFDGNFRLTSISEDGYKGNLYIPTEKTVKDIFGDLKLNENSEYRITFKDYAEYVTKYNTQAKTEPQIAIFPYVLYGLLPKYPILNDDRTVWDDSVKIGMSDIPPSINPLLLLKHIFYSRGYSLRGSAFDDDRLTNLYMSYKNDPGYVQPWNYGYHAKIKLKGTWSNLYNRQNGGVEYTERGGFQSSTESGTVYACDLFDATNTDIDIIEDTGGNVLLNTKTDVKGQTWTQCQVRIPSSGFYKVRFNASLKALTVKNKHITDEHSGIAIIGANSDNSSNPMPDKAYEIRLMRDFGKGNFNVSRSQINGVFYQNNLPQNNRFSGTDFVPSVDTPKYFPQINSNGQLLFIDPAQDANHLLGFGFGGALNPKDVEGVAQMQVAKPAISWDSKAALEKATRLAVVSPGYWRYGLLNGENDDNPDNTDEDRLDWTVSDRFKIEMVNAPLNYAKRGQFEQSPFDPKWSGQGELNSIVWLEAGELLTVTAASQEGRWRKNYNHSRYGWVAQDVSFELDIQPFRVDAEWLKVGLNGNGTAVMNWNDSNNFDTDSINIVGFLPTDIKTDDFIENFCKAFNLQLTQEALTSFRLDVKPNRTSHTNQYIDLENFASVRMRTNSPLDIPDRYRLGFTIDIDEEGYVRTGDDGGGYFETGAIEGKEVEQKSGFSYNWFKNITKLQNPAIDLKIPVISKSEVWSPSMPYQDAMRKKYTNQPIRFWYFDGLLNDSGAVFNFNKKNIALAKVSNTLAGRCELSYKNAPFTILDNYFTLIVSSSSHYTEIEGYLTVLQYEQINGSVLAKFNSDLYFIAEVSAYDPVGRNMTKLKLIPRL